MKSLLDVVRTVAPTIASAVGGPLAGMATRAISEALLGKADGTEAELIQAASQATPDQLLALKKAENEFTVKMRELEIDLERIDAGDRDSARRREVDAKDWTPRAIAGFICLGYFAVVMWMLNWGLPSTGGEAMLVLLGGLSTAFAAIISYYFGSSAGSRAKDELIRRKP